MKKILVLLLLVLCFAAAFYVYVDTNDPEISWGIGDKTSINAPLKIEITDDIGLKEVCYTVSGGACVDKKQCFTDFPDRSFDLVIEPAKCAQNAEPFKFQVAVNVVDSSLIANKVDGKIELTFDDQAPRLATLDGTRSLKRGGAGVVLYEVGEHPDETGIVLDDFIFRAFAYDQNKYLSFYVHPFYVEPDDFKPRVFARDEAGNTRKIRPGSRTAAYAYPAVEIELTDNFLNVVQEKLMNDANKTPLEAFVQINDIVRKENYRVIEAQCQKTMAQKLWEGAFLRNLGATKADFAEHRTYTYRSDVVSRQAHTGIDIAGVNNTEIVAANHGKVVFAGEIGIYGNVVILDHGYGIHSLYGHLSQIDVHEGDMVKKGDPIAVSGETGLAFGDHLHFEIRINGIPVNPIEWFDDVWVKTNIDRFLPKG